MTNIAPVVSVIVPAWNAVTTIDRALRSIRDQDYDKLEVLVVDDASVDGTADRVEAFEGLNIRLIRSKENLGASGARNLAIEQATGDYLAFLDADDEWLPGKLETQVRTVRSHPEAVFVTCEANLLGPGGKALGLINPNRERPQGPHGWKALLRQPCVATPCVLARRDRVLETGGFDPGLASGEDQDLWIRLASLGSVEHIDQVLVNVHDTGFSLSKRERSASASAILPIIRQRMLEKSDELTTDETKLILAHRYHSIGRIYTESGRYWRGFRYLWQASVQGHKPFENLLYFLLSLPPIKRLKRLVSPPRLGAEHAVTLDKATNPRLVVVVDTEEEFDWGEPFSASNRSIESIFYQDAVQELFEKYDVKPTYVLDYPIVENSKSVEVIKRYFDSGKCMIGAHLQPWVNPPYLEEQSNYNSYPGNLSFDSEFLKLKELTYRIEREFSFRPIAYKAGRYGFGPSTPKILKTLGYKVDLSIVPHTDFSNVDGFDFSGFSNEAVWLGDGLELLEVPLTRGYSGFLARLGPRLFPIISGPVGERLRLPGLFARSGLLERITLTPEGISLAEMKRLTRAMLKRGRRIFSLTYHSSSLMPGGSPYVETEADREAFIRTVSDYLKFFFEECGGKPSTPEELLRQARSHQK